MRGLLLVALLALGGCTPLAAYSVGAWPYGSELFAKDGQTESELRLAQWKRLEAGFPPTPRTIQRQRNHAPRATKND